MALRTRVKDMLARKRSRDDIAEMLRSDFEWADLRLQVGLDGLLAEMAPGP